MTISSSTIRVSYAGNGSTTEFSFPHRFLNESDLIVIATDDTTGVETTQTLNTHYTVDGEGDANGGSITFLNDAEGNSFTPASGETLVITNNPDILQPYDPADGSALSTNAMERAFDKLTLIAQRTRDLVTRSFKLPDGDTSGASLEIPSPTALNLMRWDSAGTALENVTLTDLGDSVASVADNEVLAKLPGADADGLVIGEQQFLGRLSGGNLKALTAEETRRVLDDPEHATDSATDTYVSATNTTPPADGVKITRDFPANTTTTPTLDGKTMTTRDGSALWAGAVSGVHDVQYDSGTDTYLVLEPNPSVQRDFTRAASATQKGDVELATNAETQTGTDTERAVTPAGAASTYARIATGTYTGDGTTSKGITGIGFQPKYVKIWTNGGNSTGALTIHETTTEIVDNDAAGVSVEHSAAGDIDYVTNHIISLDSDGFTVDDGGTDADPNVNGRVYAYRVIG